MPQFLVFKVDQILCLKQKELRFVEIFRQSSFVYRYKPLYFKICKCVTICITTSNNKFNFYTSKNYKMRSTNERDVQIFCCCK